MDILTDPSQSNSILLMTNELNTQNLISEFAEKSENILKAFNSYLRNISPHKIDLNQIKSISVAGKPLKDYEKLGLLMINMNGPRGVKIESLDVPNWLKINKVLLTSLMEINLDVVDKGTHILATLQQLTQDMRKDIIKQVKNSKETYKQNLNNLRADFNKKIKNSKLSEDEQNRVKNEIEKQKEKVQKSLELECINKEKFIMN